MTEKNGAAFPSPEDSSNHRHLENVVDELRSVLSDLGRPVGKSTESTSAPAPDPIPEPIQESQDREILRPTPPPFEALTPDSVVPEPVSSDADFWNGNVLGWSEKKEPDNDLALSENNVLGDIGLPDIGGPISTSNAHKVLEELGTPESDGNPIWDNLEEPVSLAPPELPKAPESPLMEFASKDAPVISEPTHENPFSPTFDTFVEEEKLPPPKEKNPGEPTYVPIPQTLDKKPEPIKAKSETMSPLEVPELKPKGVIQIACIYPEGQEKLGQSFVSKLKESGEKSKKSINIQAVFVHPWSTGNIDVGAWKKSAILSGADTMFVLVPKASAASLKGLSNDPTSEIKCRIVFMEHILMRTLYADILVDFQRGK